MNPRARHHELLLLLALIAPGCAATPKEPPCNPAKTECVVGEERPSNVMKPFPKGPFPKSYERQAPWVRGVKS